MVDIIVYVVVIHMTNVYNFNTICMLCECPEGIHCVFFDCPIFEKNHICSECCQIDALQPGVEKVFSERLCKTVTKEEILKMCQDCGRNYGVHDSDLAKRIECNDFKDLDDFHLRSDSSQKPL